MFCLKSYCEQLWLITGCSSSKLLVPNLFISTVGKNTLSSAVLHQHQAEKPMYVHKSPGTSTAPPEIPVLLVDGPLPSVGQYSTRSDPISEQSCTSGEGEQQKCFPGFGC